MTRQKHANYLVKQTIDDLQTVCNNINAVILNYRVIKRRGANLTKSGLCTMNIKSDIPFLNIHNPFTNEMGSVYLDKHSRMYLDTMDYFVKQMTTCLRVLLCSPKNFGGAYSRRLVRPSVSPSVLTSHSCPAHNFVI